MHHCPTAPWRASARPGATQGRTRFGRLRTLSFSLLAGVGVIMASAGPAQAEDFGPFFVNGFFTVLHAFLLVFAAPWPIVLTAPKYDCFDRQAYTSIPAATTPTNTSAPIPTFELVLVPALGLPAKVRPLRP